MSVLFVKYREQEICFFNSTIIKSEKKIVNTVTQKNIDLGQEDMRNNEKVRNKLTRELKVERLDGEKLAVTHPDQIAVDSN